MIVIPMAGLSSRFKKAGYELPKYMLQAHEKSLFSHSLASFEHYFDTESFLFIALNVHETEEFIMDECKNLGIRNFDIVMLENPTRGQAETVYLGVKNAGIDSEESLLIFNIDTFRPNFRWPKKFDKNEVDGYLETFVGSGANWSNVLPQNEYEQTVKLTAEKQEISKFCCTGLYYWRRSSDFCNIFEKYSKKSLDNVQAGEYYIAPMYNDLIQEGSDIRYTIIQPEEVIFCGVPSEYEDFIS